MFRRVGLGAGLTALLLTPAAFAHHPSGTSSTGSSGPIGTISATTLEQGQSVAGIVFEMVKMDTFSDAQLKDFAGKHIHAHGLDAILAPSLVFAYGLTKDLTLSARLPYIQRLDIREGSHSHGPAGNTVDYRGDSDGIGDLTLMAQYRFFNDQASRTEAALLLGIKAPTGRTGLRDGNGELFERRVPAGQRLLGRLVRARCHASASAPGRSMPTCSISSQRKARRTPISATGSSTMWAFPIALSEARCRRRCFMAGPGRNPGTTILTRSRRHRADPRSTSCSS